MKIYNIHRFLFFILVMIGPVSGQNWNSNTTTVTNRLVNERSHHHEIKNKISSEKQLEKSKLLWSIGASLSSYLHEEGGWQWGYSVGLTLNFRVYKNLSMTLPFSYTRINAAPKNVEGRFYSLDDNNVYKELTDWQISVGFLEFPVLLNYKFFITNKYYLSYLLGPGLVIAVKDFSSIENVTITDEIIGTHDGVTPLEPLNVLHSGLNINSGVRFHVNRFYIDLLYVLYPYKIKDINKLNSISLRFGIDIN